MAIEMNSLSSRIMFHNTLYGNHHECCGKLVAQIGYGFIPVVAAIEMICAAIISALTLVIYPCSTKPFAFAAKWLSSSTFSVGWSAVAFCMNPFVYVLVADEKSARQIKASGDYWAIPQGAII